MEKKTRIAVYWASINILSILTFVGFGGLEMVTSDSILEAHIGNGIVLVIVVSTIYLLKYYFTKIMK